MTFEAGGSLVIAGASQSAAVVIGCQGENSILAEFAGVVCNVIMIVATFLNELLGLIESLLDQQIWLIEPDWHNHQIIQPNFLGMSVL